LASEFSIKIELGVDRKQEVLRYAAVPTERSDEKYEVDITMGICMCEAGKHGKFANIRREF
jgi:hypothetical protein